MFWCPWYMIQVSYKSATWCEKASLCLQELFLQSAQLILLRFWGIFVGELFARRFPQKKTLDFSFSQLQSCEKKHKKIEHVGCFSPSKVSKLRNFCHSFTGSCVCWRPLWDSSILRKDSTSRFNSPSSSSFSMTTCHRKFWAQSPQCLAMTTVVIFTFSTLFPLHLFVPRYVLILKTNGSNIRFTCTKFAQIMSPWNITRISHLKPFKVMFTSHPKRDIHRKSCSMMTMKMMINSMVKSFKKTTNIFAVSTISKVIQVGPYLFPTHIHGKDEINHHITSASSNFVASRSCAKRASCRATLSNWSCLTVARSRGRWGFVEVQWGQKPCCWFIWGILNGLVVGGWTSPPEKYAQVKLDSHFLKDRGENKKYLKLPPPSLLYSSYKTE